MSQENVEIVRVLNDAFRRGEWDSVAAYLDPDVLVRADPRWPEQRVYGREAVGVRLIPARQSCAGSWAWSYFRPSRRIAPGREPPTHRDRSNHWRDQDGQPGCS